MHINIKALMARTNRIGGTTLNGVVNINCKACGNALEDCETGNYAICTVCKSANYVPSVCADIDNNKYFNAVYCEANRDLLQHRYTAFVKHDKVHAAMHRKDLNHFQATLNEVAKRIIGSRLAVEVGFGYGAELVAFLDRGANIYGLDISERAVESFQRSHPKYAERVYCGARLEGAVGVVYSNALFEHLDEPGTFLSHAFSMLDPGGCLILRLPIIKTAHYTKRQTQFDINFWKPCHRALYTFFGLERLLSTYGFKIIEHATYGYYGYKVMNSMLRHGYRDIEMVRHPCLAIEGLQSEVIFRSILVQGLFTKLICLDCVVIVEKRG